MKWLSRSTRLAIRPLRLRTQARFLTTVTEIPETIQRVSVPIGSSGTVNIDLYNMSNVDSIKQVVVYLPPFPSPGSVSDEIRLPKVAEFLPTAVINYRWRYNSPSQPAWPTPLHDVTVAYSWLVDSFLGGRRLGQNEPKENETGGRKLPAKSRFNRRDIYVCGSHLGATLAVSLALTETHPHRETSVRGCIAYNGIYDWTLFLPDHPKNHHAPIPPEKYLEDSLALEGAYFQKLKRQLPALFHNPGDLFDPFASPHLFFNTPSLWVPSTFHRASFNPYGASNPHSSLHLQPTPSRLMFPPKLSGRAIPEALFLYDKTTRSPMRVQNRNNFETQSNSMAKYMGKSVNRGLRSETEEKDPAMPFWSTSHKEWVQTHAANDGTHCDTIVAGWLKDRIPSYKSNDKPGVVKKSVGRPSSRYRGKTL